jgi:hypothetical protein
MKAGTFFSIFLLITAACSPLVAASVTDSGIVGQVTIGPMCPVVQAGSPCPDKHYQAALTVLASPSRTRVLQFQTDSNGLYRITLAPGEYILHPESPGVMPHAGEIPFVVHAGQFTRLDVSYDSGIR